MSVYRSVLRLVIVLGLKDMVACDTAGLRGFGWFYDLDLHRSGGIELLVSQYA